MVAKIMCLSLVWYHAGIMPGWELALQHIEKRVQSFIWKGSISKVAKSTLRLPKNEGGLQVWSLVDKAKAFTTMWVIKLIQNKTNPRHKTPSFNAKSMGKGSLPQPCNPRRGLDCLLQWRIQERR
jgi:hypothetical protein